ncbi:MAG: peptidase M3 [Bacteroidetes bacterium GWC2_33_15]|nr:MAG: peptidase M3 [Bacteroidetes bacterium GWA2_33_15]OFX52489.1 MAG: peptidase M3 [Bacteroidetes bacterium GWC2_33_15]OFX65550.1 MAG: peptidase M3 [Bacteroidetes bacterium GWB2_32_14]OFX67571.1 MAG: peptidase M3 [Bacteroidetes bacterium GWD2_33_33]HAN18386.1 peptidase M3 [Bacteroidales bacterium]
MVKKFTFMLFAAGLLLASCTQKSVNMENPLLGEFKTPYGVQPFDLIKTEHFVPAYLEAIKQNTEEIAAIVNNTDAPTFENTVEALEYSGKLLIRIEATFNNLNASLTGDEMQKVAQEVAPLLSKHRDDIALNAELFKRVKAVYEQKEQLALTPEQARLLEVTYKNFERGGANLDAGKQDKLRKINEELAMLNLKFGENVLAETNNFKLIIDNEADLAGLPESVKQAAADAAKADSLEGKWLFTTQKPSMLPFLTYADNRELRQKLHTAYIMRGDNNNEYDNKKVLSRIAVLSAEKAHLFGFKNYAEYVLDVNMAKNPETVFAFLNKVWDAALPIAKNEAAELQKMIDKEGGNFKLAHWDWWYYAEKLRKEKYDLDEEMLRPYFEKNNVRDGAFAVATKLWGIKFVERTDIPKYHPDVEVFEVQNPDGTFLGILYMDWYPRASKVSGAWMDEYRRQSEGVDPIITTNFNFTAPSGDKPALFSFEEVSTTFHEFGHALHGLLSNCKYHSLAATNVARDFVELPSQIMENWASEPEVLKMYAKHYQTGEVIPQELIDKISNSGLFNKGFTVLEYTSAALLDMYWYTLNDTIEQDATQFENDIMKKMGMIPEIVVRYRSPYFGHIFGGGYSSGYYSYQWAQVLDADAFSVFQEKGLFDQETAKSLRDNILSRGNTEPAMDLYKKYRGMEPQLDAFLKRNGLK